MDVISTNDCALPSKYYHLEQRIHTSAISAVENEKETFSNSVHAPDQSHDFNGSNQQDEEPDHCNLYHQNCSERPISCLSPTLHSPCHIKNRKSPVKLTGDSGCFDDIPLTNLTINKTSFPSQTSPTVSNRSYSSAGLASHTDESGTHAMNEDDSFEEEGSETCRGAIKDPHSSSTGNVSSDPKEKSEYPQQEGKNKIHLATCQFNNIETKISDNDRKNPTLARKHERGDIRTSSQSGKISGSKFNSARSVFEQNSKTNFSSTCFSENKKLKF